MNYNRYKDRDPIDTIECVKKFLNKFSLECEEIIEFSPVTNIYSCHIRIHSLNFFSNGKGTTREYCLASGYGELLERLLNFYFFSYSNKNVQYTMHDTTKFNIELLDSLPECIINDMKTTFFISDNYLPSTKELIDIYSELTGKKELNNISSKKSLYFVTSVLCVPSHFNRYSCYLCFTHSL